jgi:hypothetical protein
MKRLLYFIGSVVRAMIPKRKRVFPRGVDTLYVAELKKPKRGESGPPYWGWDRA